MIDFATGGRLAVLGVAVWVAAVWLAGLGYVVTTYIEAVSHVPPRSAGQTVRSALRETWLIMWTQPLLLVFQIAARRMGTGGGEVPIVLVHGYFQNRVDFIYLARRLRAGGCGPLYACNFFWPQSLEASAVTVAGFVDRVRRETGAERIDLLTHSSGGLLALDLIAEHPEWVRRVALIAIPLRGVTWRGPVIGQSGSELRADSRYTQQRPERVDSGPVLSVYSAHDNLVHPPSTSRIEGAQVTTLELDNLGHLSVLFEPRVGDAVCEFLLGP